jgi:hypothetical protein
VACPSGGRSAIAVTGRRRSMTAALELDDAAPLLLADAKVAGGCAVSV